MSAASLKQFQEQQAILQRQYAARALKDADQMEMLLDNFEHGQTHVLVELRHLAHRLAGGSGVFGLGQLTQPALDLEHSIDNCEEETQIRAKTTALADHIRQAAMNKS